MEYKTAVRNPEREIGWQIYILFVNGERLLSEKSYNGFDFELFCVFMPVWLFNLRIFKTPVKCNCMRIRVQSVNVWRLRL